MRTEALKLVRSLLKRGTVQVDGRHPVLKLEGALIAMIEAAQPVGLNGIDLSSVDMVAGAGFEPATFRL
jgi:site-specific DNA recombinase